MKRTDFFTSTLYVELLQAKEQTITAAARLVVELERWVTDVAPVVLEEKRKQTQSAIDKIKVERETLQTHKDNTEDIVIKTALEDSIQLLSRNITQLEQQVTKLEEEVLSIGTKVESFKEMIRKANQKSNLAYKKIGRNYYYKLANDAAEPLSLISKYSPTFSTKRIVVDFLDAEVKEYDIAVRRSNQVFFCC